MATNAKSNRSQAFTQLLLFAGIVVFVNILVNVRIGRQALYAQIDLTEEKRFTLTPATEALLEGVDDVIFIKVLLEGDFPAPLKRLQNATLETLEDFRSVSPYIEFDFEDPSQGTTEQINNLREQLRTWGLQPTDFGTTDASQIIYPFAMVRYGDRVFPVNLLENVPSLTPDESLNLSVSLLEYKLANAIQKVRTSPNERKFILFTEGHGELDSLQTFDFQTSLEPFYATARVNLDNVVMISPEVKLLVVAKPRFPFSEKDKFKIDQYVMNGGKVLWLIDHVAIDLDTLLVKNRYYPAPYQLNLEDLWFRYGIRFNDNLVLDYQCSAIPLIMGQAGTRPRFFKYPYHPVIIPDIDHPVSKGLGLVNMSFPSSLDTEVQPAPSLQRQVLLRTSENSMYQRLPVEMDFDFLRYPLKEEAFQKPPQPVAMLVEGEFPSFYANRASESMIAGMQQLNMEIKDQSLPTAMIVVADGDIARNEVNRQSGQVAPLGFNKYAQEGRGYVFKGNKNFLINSVEYLVNDFGVFEARNKEVKLRLLNRMKAETEKTKWQLINVLLPLVLLGLFGLGYHWWRRRRYA